MTDMPYKPATSKVCCAVPVVVRCWALWGRGAQVYILLIDDHDLFREGLKYLLPVLDNKVRYFDAGSMDEALQFAEKTASRSNITGLIHARG
jgi:hypothetical protein